MTKLSRALALILCLAVAFSVFGCAQPAATPAAESAPAADNSQPAAAEAAAEPAAASADPIIIGQVDATSGASAPMGLPAREGLQFAIDECNANGGINGREIKLICYDNEADAATSATEVTKLIEEDGAIAVITGSNSGICNSDKIICSDSEVVNIVSIGTADTVIDDPETFHNTFRVGAPESYLIQLIGFVIKDAGYQKVGVIADTSGYGQTATATITEVFETIGIPIEMTVQHESGATDLTAQVLQMKNAGCDCVVSYNLGADAALTVSTIAELDWTVPTFGGRGLNMSSFLELVGEHGEGIVFPCDSDASSAKMKTFIEKYLAAGNDECDNYMFAAMGYATGQVVIEALTRSNGEGGDALRTALESIQDFETVLGQDGATISFSPTKHESVNTKRDVLMTIKDKAFSIYNATPYEEQTDRYEENY